MNGVRKKQPAPPSHHKVLYFVRYRIASKYFYAFLFRRPRGEKYSKDLQKTQGSNVRLFTGRLCSEVHFEQKFIMAQQHAVLQMR